MIKIICASTGGNLKLAKVVELILKESNIENELVLLEDYNLPLYCSNEEKKGIPEQAIKLTESLRSGKGLVVIAPEYNGSMPPMLNNAFAWVSRSTEDWREVFKDKFALVMTHSGGGGDKVIRAVKSQLEHLGCNPLARSFKVTYDKEVNQKTLKAALLNLVKIVNHF